MSPSWRERVVVGLSPREVTLVRWSRGMRPRVKDRKAMASTPATGADGWRNAVEVLREALTHPNVAAADAEVVVSNHFVRYLLLPFNAGLVSAQEELAFARARYVQVFGDTAQAWSLKISRTRPGAAGVASAIPQALVEAVGAVLASSPLNLRSLRPALMEVCNARAKLPRGEAWMAIADTGNLLVGAMRNGEWLSLRSRPVNGHAVPLARIIGQEALLLGLEQGNERVYLHRSGDVALDLDGLDVRDWLTDGPAQRSTEAA